MPKSWKTWAIGLLALAALAAVGLRLAGARRAAATAAAAAASSPRPARELAPLDVLTVGRHEFARGLEVTGVDVAPAMIAAARTEAGRRGSRAEFHVVDGERLPFGAAAFDAVVIWSQVLGNVPLAAGRQAFLAEARRVIRPGGAMSLSAHDAALTRPMLAPERIVRADDPEPGDLVIQEPREASVRYFRYFDRDDLTNLCAFAGFAVEALVHTDDLGEAWGNVFVLMARAI